MLAILVFQNLAGLVFASEVCNDPPNLAHKDKRSDVIVGLMGLTGAGKSVFTNYLAGGIDLSKEGESLGASQTEETCIVHFDFLKGTVPPAERWTVLDIPGLADTGGGAAQTKNAEIIESALHEVKETDAIAIVWPSNRKFTQETMHTIEFVRGTFGPDVWGRIIMVYTFWPWEETRGRRTTCHTPAELEKVHETVMQGVFDHLKTSRIGVLQRCGGDVTGDCFPAASTIPYIGLDIRMEDLEDDDGSLFDPKVKDDCTKQGTPNLASQFYDLQRYIHDIQKQNNDERMDVSKVSSCWLSCQKAGAMLKASPSQPEVVDELAFRIYGCIRGGFRDDIDLLSGQLSKAMEPMNSSNDDFWLSVAFKIGDREMITHENGFPPVASAAVNKYPDFNTYKACAQAADSDVQDIPTLAENFAACYQGINAEGSRPPNADDAEPELRDAYKDRLQATRKQIGEHCVANQLGCPPFGLCKDACGESRPIKKPSAPESCGQPVCQQKLCCQRPTNNYLVIMGLIALAVLGLVALLVFLFCRKKTRAQEVYGYDPGHSRYDTGLIAGEGYKAME